jgi:hypothetical protein
LTGKTKNGQPNSVPTANSTNNVTESDVIGNKTDTGRTTGATTYSVLAYVKGLVAMLELAGADSSNNTYIRDVVGNKTDTQVLVKGTTKSLVAMAKGALDQFLIAGADDATNDYVRQGVGNKTDTARTAVATAYSIMSYVKGIVTMLTKPSADSTNNVYVADVVGSKDDAAQTTVGTTRSLMGYLKGVLSILNGHYTFISSAIAQASPVQNTWYDVIASATSRYVLHSFGIRIATTGETLEARIIIDGVTLTAAGVACTAGTEYYVTLSYATGATSGAPTLTIGSTAAPILPGANMYGKAVQVSVRKTTASGTGTLYGRVNQAKWV